MFDYVPEQEPEEYVRLVSLYAVNESILAHLEDYDSGTDAPPDKAIETRLLGADTTVSASYLAEYRTTLVRYREHLLLEMRQFKRQKVAPYEFGESQAKQQTATRTSRPGTAGKEHSGSRNVRKRKGAAAGT